MAINLPKLAVLKDDDKIIREASTCQGKDYCTSCKLFKKNGGRCGGCSQQHKDVLTENFKWCYQQCNTCTGYPPDKVQVTAICCRSPLKDLYLDQLAGSDWNKPKFVFTKRPRLKFKQRAVFYISSGGVPGVANSHPSKLIVPEGAHEIVAVNLPCVWSGKGFYSHDLHDYLKLPTKTKIILVQMCLDDLLERAWETGMYEKTEEFQKVGISYWMPVAVSAYRHEAHMHQYYQFLRMMRTTEVGKSWFASGSYRRKDMYVDDLILQAIESIPQVIFNTQFLVTDDILKQFLMEMRWFHQNCKPEVSFWFVGSATPRFVHNVRKQIGMRDAYFLSANVLMCGVKGKRLYLDGKSKKDPELGRWDLLQENYHTFSRMVEEYG